MRILAIGIGLVAMSAIAAAQVTVTAIERNDLVHQNSRAFDLRLNGLTLDQAFVRADLMGQSPGGDFRNPEPNFDIGFCFNNVDSFMALPWSCPNGEIHNFDTDPENRFTATAIDWGWNAFKGGEHPGLNGVVARIMLAYGGTGEIDITVRGNFTDGGTWSEPFHLIIPEPATLGPLLLGAWLAFAARRR